MLNAERGVIVVKKRRDLGTCLRALYLHFDQVLVIRLYYEIQIDCIVLICCENYRLSFTFQFAFVETCTFVFGSIEVSI